MAARYTDWSHTHVVGSRQAAAAYVPEARKLLGYVTEDAKNLNLQTHQVRRELPDGALIIAEIRGGIPRMTIVPPVTGGQQRKAKPKEDFVVWARAADRVDGIDAEFPQQILKPSWRTFFYDTGIDGYDDFPGDKGTYRRGAENVDLFPDGIQHAGNVDWVGPKGERLSWYGPSSRYWYDTCRQPSDQFGCFVFLLGQVLLDIDAYCTASDVDFAERQVLGAAWRTIEGVRWLYVMQGDIAEVSAPQVTVPAFTIYFSQMSPPGSIPLALYRYRIVEDTDSTHAMRWSVAAESHELLWAASVARAANPWVFNTSATKATTFAIPESNLFVFSDRLSEVLVQGPSTSQERIDLSITPGGITRADSSASLAAGSGARAVLAIDYVDDALREVVLERRAHEDSSNALVLSGEGWSVPLWFKRTDKAGYVMANIARRLAWVDARAGAVACWQQDMYGNVTAPAGAIDDHIAVFIGGVNQALLTDRQQSSTTSFVEDRDIGALVAGEGVATAPQSWLMMLSAQVTPITSRAALLGLSYSYVATPFSVAATFGQYRVTRNAGGLSLQVSALATDNFNNSALDVDGHRSPFGAACSEGTLLISCFRPNPPAGAGAADPSVHYASTSSLPELTGVAGANARFHPIWLLGKPPAA